MSTTLVAEKKSPPKAASAAGAVAGPGTGWSLLGASGLALAVAGFADVALMWYPMRFGNLDWEFATLSGTFDALPLGVIGVSMIAASLAAHRGRLTLVFAGILALLLIGLLAAAMLYALTVVAGLKTLDPSIQTAFYRAVTKTSVLAVTYITLFGWLALRLARVGRRKGETT